MSLNSSDKNEVERIARKEIKDFLGTNTVKQFEDKLIDKIASEIKRGKLEGEMKDVIIKAFRAFYNFMWTNRSYWESRIK